MKIIKLKKGLKLEVPDKFLKCEHAFPADFIGRASDCRCGMSYSFFCLMPEKKPRGRKPINRVNEAPYVENTESFFNVGLGCVTHGTRDAEKKGKRLGLVCTGGEIPKMIKPKDEITPILEHGLRRLAHEGKL